MWRKQSAVPGHIKYLYDTSCGLYFHGYDFKGRHNYGRVHWARGNSWYTCGIMELIGLIPIEPGLRQYFLDTFRAQVDALCACQAGDGMWHTILDDPASYKESSATAAFAYGMLKGVRLGFLPAQYEAPALRARARPCWPAWMPRASWVAFPTARLWAMTHSFIRISPSVP